MQAEDDERKDLERALFARPSGDAEDATRRHEAERRLRGEREAERAETERAETERAETEPREAHRPAAATAVASRATSETPPDRSRRPVLLVGAALAVGLVLGAAATALLPGAAGTPAPTPSATARLEDRYAALLEGWVVATDLPIGMALIARDADVFTPEFDTAQEDRLLVTAPGGVSLCLALQRGDGSLSAGCTGLEAFFDAGSLDVVGTDRADGAPVYTRVSLRSDGSVEGGFQRVQEP
ncbi:hypothetical protein NB037_10275 [Rathayibacter sp. ZW T2_19]|uniref:Uncharacterized protein n=1 Tax=Rathayibacter rubneri TaxID=2950106 RepID=A0A9X2DYS1_9MICO|nr:hypothetical protein [Rathayibacter rubneri]MCM6762801.1 hypothetical protein [Rathayibacter rubneri]